MSLRATLRECATYEPYFLALVEPQQLLSLGECQRFVHLLLDEQKNSDYENPKWRHDAQKAAATGAGHYTLFRVAGYWLLRDFERSWEAARFGLRYQVFEQVAEQTVALFCFFTLLTYHARPRTWPY